MQLMQNVCIHISTGWKCEIHRQMRWSFVTFNLCRIWHHLMPIFSWSNAPSAGMLSTMLLKLKIIVYKQYIWKQLLVWMLGKIPSHYLSLPLGFIYYLSFFCICKCVSLVSLQKFYTTGICSSKLWGMVLLLLQ